MQISLHRKFDVNIMMGFGSVCNKSKQRAQEDAAGQMTVAACARWPVKDSKSRQVQDLQSCRG